MDHQGSPTQSFEPNHKRDIPSSLLNSILSEKKHQVQPTLKGKELHKGVVTRRWGLLEAVSAVRPSHIYTCTPSTLTEYFEANPRFHIISSVIVSTCIPKKIGVLLKNT